MCALVQGQEDGKVGKRLVPHLGTKQRIAKKHTTVSIRWWSPTQLLIDRSKACLWQSGRDAEFSLVCGRMYEQAA